jgi:hypothetical protein
VAEVRQPLASDDFDLWEDQGMPNLPGAAIGAVMRSMRGAGLR